MTGCIVGWAHTPFGRLRWRDRRKPDRAGRQWGAGGCRNRGQATWTRSCSATSMRAFRRRISPPRWCLQASPDLRFKRATRVENACATGSAAVHQGMKTIEATRRARRACGRCRADDDDAGAGDRTKSVESLLCARGGRYRWRFCRDFRQDRRALFPAMGRPVRRAGHDRGQEPQERRRQSLCADAQGSGLRVLPHRERKKSVCRRPAQAHRLLAGVGWRRGAWCSPMSRPHCKLKKAVAFRAAEHVQDFLPMSKRDILKFEGCAQAWQTALAKAGTQARRSVVRGDARLLHHRRTDRIRSHGA